MSKPNIVILVPSLVEAGAERQSVYLAISLLKDYNVALIILNNIISKKNQDLINKYNINLILIDDTNLIKKGFKFYKYIKVNKPKIIFSYLASGNLLNRIAGFLAGVKYRIGGIRNTVLPPMKIPLEKFFHNYLLTKTISNSHSAVNSLSKLGFKPEKFHIIHNAFSLNQQEIIRPVTNVVNIISVARFVLQKDYYTALQAIASLKDRLTHSQFDFKYFLIGYGEQEAQIREWVKDLGVEDKVEVVIKPDNLEEYFKKADIFLTTSLFEGLSNSVMEALSFSLPVVATPAGDMEYLVKHGKNGYIVETGDVKGISDKLNILINDYDLRIKMGLKSYEILSKNFSMKKFKKEYLKLIDNLVNGK